MLNHAYENEFSLHLNENFQSYERMSNRARSENEAEGNSEMAFSWNVMRFCENMFSKLLKIFSSQPFPAAVNAGQALRNRARQRREKCRRKKV